MDRPGPAAFTPVDPYRISPLIDAAERELRDAPGSALTAPFDAVREGLREQALSAGLYRPAAGEPAGFVLFQRVPRRWRIAVVAYLRPALRYARTWAGLVDAVRSATNGNEPVGFWDPLLLPPEDLRARAAFFRRGLRPLSRFELKFPISAPIPRLPADGSEEIRPLLDPDRAELVRLHERSYAGHIDRFLFASAPSPAQDSEALVRDLLAGDWGRFASEFSFATYRHGRLIGATLVTHWSGLIAELAVDPDFQRRGVGARLLARTLEAMREGGCEPVRLAVSEPNEPALRLYRRFGFVRAAPPVEEWLDAGVVGLPKELSGCYRAAAGVAPPLTGSPVASAGGRGVVGGSGTGATGATGS